MKVQVDSDTLNNMLSALNTINNCLNTVTNCIQDMVKKAPETQLGVTGAKKQTAIELLENNTARVVLQCLNLYGINATLAMVMGDYYPGIAVSEQTLYNVEHALQLVVEAAEANRHVSVTSIWSELVDFNFISETVPPFLAECDKLCPTTLEDIVKAFLYILRTSTPVRSNAPIALLMANYWLARAGLGMLLLSRNCIKILVKDPTGLNLQVVRDECLTLLENGVIVQDSRES